MREITASNPNNFVKRISRCKSFHFRYLELCRAKNYTPSTEIKNKNNATSILDFFGDKLKADDWLFIIESLYCDQTLQHLAIRLRKYIGPVVQDIDSEKKAKLFKLKPVVYAKYIFSGVVEAIANCIQYNRNLVVLNLEALPLNENYVATIAKALSNTEQLIKISFQRSPIGDSGCEALCSTIKYLASVETLNMSECNLTVHAAAHIGDLIKFQKICRYSQGWQKSLRYRDVDPSSLPGLRVIEIARNPDITDDGVGIIVEILKEDAWIKIIDMENCGITDVGADLILNCLEINNTIIDFNIRNNVEVSKFFHRNIRQQLGKDEDNFNESDKRNSTNSKKVLLAQQRERIKFLEEQNASEKILRKEMELLSEKLQKQLAESENSAIPEGYVLVKKESLESIINENELYKAASMAKLSKTKDFLKKISKVRKVKSEEKYKKQTAGQKISKSDCELGVMNAHPNSIVFEKNIGDNVTFYQPQLTARIEKSKTSPYKDYDTNSIITVTTENSSNEKHQDASLNQFEVILTKKQNCEHIPSKQAAEDTCYSPRSFFIGSSARKTNA